MRKSHELLGCKKKKNEKAQCWLKMCLTALSARYRINEYILDIYLVMYKY